MTLTQTLESMGYRVRLLGPFPIFGILIRIEVTDRTTAATVYLPEHATLEQCLQRMKEKRQQFEKSEQQ